MKQTEYSTDVIARKLQRRREHLRLTRDQLAKLAKINYNTIIKLESGASKNPTISTLINLAYALRTSVRYFITR